MNIASSFKETQKLGFDIAKKLKGRSILALYGDLGSGKTTFVQGLAKGLGIKQKIISPTFIIVRKYKIPDYSSSGAERSREVLKSSSRQARTINFYHIDLYRIESEKDVHGLGLEEILNDPSNIIAIEWPEKIEKILPKKRYSLFFEYIQDNKRKIKIDM